MSQPRIGILGGGQLARMLCIEGFKMNLEMHVLSSAASDPAAQVTRHWHQGDVQTPKDVSAFFKQVDVATFESEFLSESVLLEAEAKAHVQVLPRVQIISELSDRLKQKTWLEHFHIPTSRFSGLVTKQDLQEFVGNKKNYVTVLKKRRFGYDGYGTFIVRGQKALEEWLRENETQLSQFIIEDFQPFQRELAVQFAVSACGDICVYPLIEWQAENSRCLWVKGPVKTRFQKGYNELIKKIKSALIKSKYVGLIAFEIFETPKGLLVNEVAPRVHNSAHYSLEAMPLNQFKAHLCAILGHRLPKSVTPSTGGFAMVNILGREQKAKNDLVTQVKAAVLAKTDIGLKAENKNSLQNHLDAHNEHSENAYIHWYGKTDYRAGRKLGHVTTLAAKPDLALREALRIRKRMHL